jgi:ABC-type sugar transport system ATPase subunit
MGPGLIPGENPAPVSTGAGIPALRVIGLEKVYGGELALAGVDLTVQAGEIHGLLGANGAGKSTLVRIVSGAEPPSGGSVEVFGRNIQSGVVGRVRHPDVAYIHQDRALAGDLSIADNIALSVGFPKRFGLVDRRATARQAREAMTLVNIDLDPSKLIRELTIGEQTLIAIARALASSAKLILLDEPTANLGARERESLLERLRGLSAQGVASLLITHSLDEALEVCHCVTILRNGYTVATRSSSELTTDDVAAMMMGRSVSVQASDEHLTSGEDIARGNKSARLHLQSFALPGLGPLDFEVMPGEIVGVTGLADSGHLLLGEALMGATPAPSGSVQIDGRSYEPKSVDRARRNGIGFVPADRLRDGLAPTLNLRENLFLDGENPGGKRSRRTEVASASDLLKAAGVKPPDPEALISTLSGGNMQKVLVAKWLAMKPQILILSEPTVGVDVGAREEIYRLIRQACKDGISVVLTSSDCEELARLCDRVVILRAGAMVAAVTGGDITAENLTALSSSRASREIHSGREGALAS